jgi:hypothetical protein
MTRRPPGREIRVAIIGKINAVFSEPMMSISTPEMKVGFGELQSLMRIAIADCNRGFSLRGGDSVKSAPPSLAKTRYADDTVLGGRLLAPK